MNKCCDKWKKGVWAKKDYPYSYNEEAYKRYETIHCPECGTVIKIRELKIEHK